ncbi:MAG TPA: hypothetical protein VEJ84_02545 [Acidimicrobiales bacterium]|nr:hypothetical protein [Acidimicrobiales bacterium]
MKAEEPDKPGELWPQFEYRGRGGTAFRAPVAVGLGVPAPLLSPGVWRKASRWAEPGSSSLSTAPTDAPVVASSAQARLETSPWPDLPVESPYGEALPPDGLAISQRCLEFMTAEHEGLV